ncbi:hypothetical protein SCUP234_03767 [Seiridium cupressi]
MATQSQTGAASQQIAVDSNAVNRNNNNSNAAQVGTTQTRTVQTGTAQAGTAQTSAAQTNTTQTGTAQSQAVRANHHHARGHHQNPPRDTKATKSQAGHIKDWLYKQVGEPFEEISRIETATYGYFFKRIYDRQPRYVGHFLFKLISNVDWIPRFFFEWACFLIKAATTSAVQLIDIFFVLAFGGLWEFPWASTLYYAFIVILATIPYSMYTTEDHAYSPILWVSLYAAWFTRMTYVYINRPETWIGYTRNSHFPWLTLGDVATGPYWLLAAAIAVFVHFERNPITAPLFLSNY